MNFGERLVRLRREKYVKQEKLAEILELTQQTISSYEKGKKNPSLAILVKLAKEFNVSIDYLLLGNITCDSGDLSDEQKEVLKLYDRIPKENRKLAKKILNSIADKVENEE